MKLPCSHCGKICLLDDFHEIDYSVEGFFAFCSKECKEKSNSLDRIFTDHSQLCELSTRGV
jgi:hypothetical protein